MKANIQQKLSQTQRLSHQLQQAIQLMSLPSGELEQHILSALAENPFLEHTESLSENLIDAQFTRTRQKNTESYDDDWLQNIQAPETLHSYLQWQCDLGTFSDEEYAIACTLIDAINEEGYLPEDIEGLFKQTLDAQTLRLTLHRVQQFDPPGIAARNLSECLRLQLTQLTPQDAISHLAIRLVENHLEALAEHKPEALAEQLQVPLYQLMQAFHLIQKLNPKPGLAYAPSPPRIDTPDLIAYQQGSIWRATLCEQALPGIDLNHEMIAQFKASKHSSAELNEQMHAAMDLVKGLKLRNQSLSWVGQAIVRHQQAFFTEGPNALKPLNLRTLAEQTGLHQSTLSRLTSHKTIHTPRGLFALKYFLSGGITTEEGETLSSTAIQTAIAQLVEKEDPANPLSDKALVACLAEQHIPIARRTVAKYREALNIPPYTQRKRP